METCAPFIAQVVFQEEFNLLQAGLELFAGSRAISVIINRQAAIFLRCHCRCEGKLVRELEHLP